MKKVISAIIFVVLAVALSVMAVAVELVPISPVVPEEKGKKVLNIVDFQDSYYVTSPHGIIFYIMLDDQNYKDVTVTGNGIVSASYVDYDPEEMVAVDSNENEVIPYMIICEDTGEVVRTNCAYEVAKELLKVLNSSNEGNYYLVPQININIIEIVVGKNYSASYKIGSVITKATLNGKEYKGNIDVLSDVYFKYFDETKESSENEAALSEGINFQNNKNNAFVLMQPLTDITVTNNSVDNEGETPYDFVHSINIDRWPDKTIYYVGETIDLTGMRVSAIAYKLNAEKKVYEPFEIDVTDFCWAEPSVVTYDEAQNVTVYLKAPGDQWGNIKTFSDHFRVTVKERYEEDNGSEEYDPIYDSIELNVGKDPGCSDYLAHIGDYFEDKDTPATVLTTKAFALAAGGKAVVKGDFFTLTIPEVSPNQKGVNFYNEIEVSESYESEKRIKLSFFSDTIMQSDYSVRINLGIDYAQLREFFDIKVEESDITVFYVYNDEGVCIGKNTVDYFKIDARKEASFYIEEKAGETLKKYTITVDEPENPENIPELNDTLSISNKKIIPGGQTTVSINLSENSDAAMAQFAVKYDPAVLRLVSASAGELMSDATINSANPGIVYFGWDNPTSVTESGTILNLTFTTVEGAEFGKTNIEIDDDEKFVFAKANLENLSIDVENGSIEIVEAVYGDLSGDGEIDIRDAYLARLVAAKLITPTEIQFIVGDVDGDGKITAVDANYIRKYVVKLIGGFPVNQ